MFAGHLSATYEVKSDTVGELAYFNKVAICSVVQYCVRQRQNGSLFKAFCFKAFPEVLKVALIHQLLLRLSSYDLK